MISTLLNKWNVMLNILYLMYLVTFSLDHTPKTFLFQTERCYVKLNFPSSGTNIVMGQRQLKRGHVNR